ncbi:MAG: WecB/TagA/CpsF family glycosyltransferase [Ruminococcaceae bacterium]|nr:WecB/TagA/CpsF family glycosyltransferase [Oscillospiraceae bacterium]
MNKIDILGVLVDHVDMAGALARLQGFLNEDTAHAVFTPNSEIIMVAHKDPEFCKTLNSGDLIVADGIGVVYASKILKAPLPERVAGFDLSSKLIESVKDGSRSLYFFGGKPGVAELAIQNLKEQYPDLCVCGFSDGYFDEAKEKQIIEDIKTKKPDILFVCLGAPKQEKWIADHKDELGAKLLLGVGGSLDVWAGTVERAPEKYQKAGLEWFYRLMKQPSRFFRMLSLPKFGLTVLFKGKRVKKGDRV